jgi:CheY-like chemotaxis protein
MSLVLVVDDSPTIRGVVTGILNGHGFETLTAEDGEAALVRLRERRPDVVLTDFVMPKMNGFQLCREIRMDPKLKDIPIVLMSAKGDKLRGHFVQATGAVDALTKPFDPLALLAVIENALARKNATAVVAMDSLPPGPRASSEPASEPNAARAPSDDPGERRAELAREVAGAVTNLVLPALAALADRTSTSRESLEATLTAALTPAGVDGLVKLLQGAEAARPAVDPNVILSGDLSCISIPEVLQMLELQRQTGALHIVSQKTEIVLYLREGFLDFARGHGLSSSYRLGRHLVQAGALTRDQLRAALEAASGGKRLLGEALVQDGTVGKEQVLEALRQQTSELVYEVVGWRHGRFTFIRGGTCTEAALSPLGLAPGGIVMEGFRRVDEWRLIESTIDFDETLLKDPGIDVRLGGASELTEEERHVLDAVDGMRSVREIVDVVPASTFDVCKILYQFLNSRIVRRRAA